MTEVHYNWAPGEAYPIIQQHSVAKHDILRAYLVAYIQTLISNPNRHEFRLALVDGFAGGGVYRHAVSGEQLLGSPFIMLESATEAAFLINKDRHKPVTLNLDYFFIEQDKGASTMLEHELKAHGYGSRIGQDIHLRNSTFDDEASSIIESVQKKMPRAGRAIFLLDQYGYSKVPTALINSILTKLPGSEVILTFAVDSLLTYISDHNNMAQNMLNKIGTPDVLRGRSVEDIKQNEKDWRLFIQSCLYKDLVENCDARYYTLFFIRSDKGHGDYWLIHFSQRARARDVMTRIHWQKNTSFIHYGGAGMNMFKALGYIPSQDSSFTGQASLGFCFDESAKAASVNALMEQMPDHVYHDDEGITFGEMFATTCNDSPASADIYRDAVGKLMELNEVEVISSDGAQRRSANRIHDSDLIVPPRQRKLIF